MRGGADTRVYKLLPAAPLVALLMLALAGGVLVCKAGEKVKPEKEKE